VVTVGLLLAVAFGGVPAHARDPYRNQHLVAGIRLYADLDYEAALEQLRKAKADPANPVPEEVAIDFYEGMCLAALNRTEPAIQAFKQGLALEPGAELPERVSPKIKKIYDEAKVDIAKAARDTKTDLPIAPPPPPPMPSATPPVVVSAAPPPFAATPTVEKTPEENSALKFAPWVTLGGGVVLGGIGGYFGVTAHNEANAAKAPGTSGLDIQRHNQSANSDALIANVLFGTAGACAVATVILFVVRRNGESSGSSH